MGLRLELAWLNSPTLAVVIVTIDSDLWRVLAGPCYMTSEITDMRMLSVEQLLA